MLAEVSRADANRRSVNGCAVLLQCRSYFGEKLILFSKTEFGMKLISAADSDIVSR